LTGGKTRSINLAAVIFAEFSRNRQHSEHVTAGVVFFNVVSNYETIEREVDIHGEEEVTEMFFIYSFIAETKFSMSL